MQMHHHRSMHQVVVEGTAMITKGDAPDWKVAEFKKSRNIIGTLVVIIELLISILKLHHLWHFISLLPLALGGMLGLLSIVRC